jgi:hypothetical protein
MNWKFFGIVSIIMLMSFTLAPQAIDQHQFFVKADQTDDLVNKTYNNTQDISESINETQQMIIDLTNKITDLFENLTVRMDSNYTELASLVNNVNNEIQNLDQSIQDLNFSGIEGLETRLDIIDDMVSDINDRLGYPTNKPDATLYDDLSLILDGLTYEGNGTRLWLLKNASGVPHLQILGKNQQTIADYQIKMNSSLQENINLKGNDVKQRIGVEANSVSNDIGGVGNLVIFLLILIGFFIAWKLFLKERFFPSVNPGGEFPNPDTGGYGKPSCFGDPNVVDPGENPNCASCKWLPKCQATAIRNSATEEPELVPEYDDKGNLIAIYDGGDQIDLPSCFGRECDPERKQDCRECAIVDICKNQTEKNMKNRVNIPERPRRREQSFSQGGISRPSRKPSVGASFREDILDDF